MSKTIHSAIAIALFLGLYATSTVQAGIFAKDETPGERFRKAIERESEYCATHSIKPANRRCDITKLRPADPLATEAGRYAHSIKIPNPVPEDSGYRPGMTPKEYFDHLCQTEAGEFIYKTVENVEGLYMMRPRQHATDDELSHLYALEDPYGYENWEATHPERIFVRPGRYEFMEVPIETSASQLVRFSRFDDRDPTTSRERVHSLRSRFGYTWRGITRPHDRELGIAGGELIVWDLLSTEVLAVRRAYTRSGDAKNNMTGVWWPGGHVCPVNSTRLYRTYEFIAQVLKSDRQIKESSDVGK